LKSSIQNLFCFIVNLGIVTTSNKIDIVVRINLLFTYQGSLIFFVFILLFNGFSAVAHLEGLTFMSSGVESESFNLDITSYSFWHKHGTCLQDISVSEAGKDSMQVLKEPNGAHTVENPSSKLVPFISIQDYYAQMKTELGVWILLLNPCWRVYV